MGSQATIIPESPWTLEQRVRAGLSQHHLPGLRRLGVEAAGDTVLISGLVSAFYQKQLAIECCKRVPGVRQIVDQIEVESRPFVRVDGATPLSGSYIANVSPVVNRTEISHS